MSLKILKSALSMDRGRKSDVRGSAVLAFGSGITRASLVEGSSSPLSQASAYITFVGASVCA